jgi:hypothetical protein
MVEQSRTVNVLPTRKHHRIGLALVIVATGTLTLTRPSSWWNRKAIGRKIYLGFRDDLNFQLWSLIGGARPRNIPQSKDCFIVENAENKHSRRT